MNTLQVMAYSAPYPGNFMRSIEALSSEITRRGSEVVYVLPSGARDLDWVQELVLQGRAISFLSGDSSTDARLIRSLLKEHQVGVVHSHFLSWRDQFAISLAALGRGVVSIEHRHNHPESGRAGIASRLKRMLVRTDAYIGVSQDVVEDMVGKGYDARKCYPVPNAIDFARLDAFDDSGGGPEPADDARRRVLLFGFDFRRKGVDVALEALATFDGGEEMVLLIAVAANRDLVIAGIEESLGGVPEWVRLLPPRDDIAAYYEMADVFVSPSREEGFCYALVEAAYVGLPIVASDIPGQRELKIPHTNQFESEDALGLYQGIRRALESRGEGAAHREEARRYVIDQFRMDHWVDGILSVYGGLNPEPDA